MTNNPDKELRYQIVDAINSGLKKVPGVHWFAKTLARQVLGKRLPNPNSRQILQRPAPVIVSRNLPKVPKRQAEFAACTIIARNYLSAARVLAESFGRFHPDSPFFVLLLDPVEGYFDPAQEPFDIVEAAQLDVPNLEGVLFKYNILEASTALKPYFLQQIFEQHDVSKLIYLDPDIVVMNPLEGISRLLEEHSIVLVPHITSPYYDESQPSEISFLQSGSFNLGFLGLRNDPTARALLHWWQDRVYHHGLSAVQDGMFVDQKWMDLSPALFEDVKILRNLGYNIAYWNLHERHIQLGNGEYDVNGQPCYFFHFSGYDPSRPEIVSKHQNRFSMEQVGDAAKLFELYRQQLLLKGWEQTHRWPYRYDYYESGASIPTSVRRKFWQLGPEATLSDCLPAAPKASFPKGINVVGYVQSEKGVGEAMRAILRSIAAQDIPHVTNSFADTGSKNVEKGVQLFQEQPFGTNVVCVNADQVAYFARRRKKYFQGRYNIGLWNWELSWFPEQWLGSFDHFGEIWAPSNFVRDALLPISPIPVIRIPYSIDPEQEVSPGWTRARLGIPPDAFLFYFSFDFLSFMERKNPIGLIKAFQKAFGDREDVALLIKHSHADDVPGALDQMRNACRGKNIKLMGEILPRADVKALMALCDCYVSLHRSEGFGLTMSEAMSFGKPVIATAYSSNTDFMDSTNSYPVRYRLIEIENDHGPYKKGKIWADPDLEHAADLMLHVFDHRAEAASIAEKGRKHIWAQLHPRAVGEMIKTHLMALSLLPVDTQSPNYLTEAVLQHHEIG